MGLLLNSFGWEALIQIKISGFIAQFQTLGAKLMQRIDGTPVATWSSGQIRSTNLHQMVATHVEQVADKLRHTKTPTDQQKNAWNPAKQRFEKPLV